MQMNLLFCMMVNLQYFPSSIYTNLPTDITDTASPELVSQVVQVTDNLNS
jgi:hypothetical protein